MKLFINCYCCTARGISQCAYLQKNCNSARKHQNIEPFHRKLSRWKKKT